MHQKQTIKYSPVASHRTKPYNTNKLCSPDGQNISQPLPLLHRLTYFSRKYSCNLTSHICHLIVKKQRIKKWSIIREIIRICETKRQPLQVNHTKRTNYYGN